MSLDCKENKTLSKISKILLPVLALCWMMVIFWFSAAPAPESSEMSYTVGLQVGKIAVADFDAWTTEEQNAFAEKIEYPIRKIAHADRICNSWNARIRNSVCIWYLWKEGNTICLDLDYILCRDR